MTKMQFIQSNNFSELGQVKDPAKAIRVNWFKRVDAIFWNFYFQYDL